MRNSMLASLALACGALLVSFGANALPIKVGLQAADGHHSWTSDPIGDHGTLTLSGWEFDDWMPANMFYNEAEGGLGVTCLQAPPGNTCGANQIGSVPWQMIDIDISALTGWESLTINLGSVGDTGSDNVQGIGYLLGATCLVSGECTPVVLASCGGSNSDDPTSCSFNLSYSELLGISHIWITPSATDPDGVNRGNIVLGADFILFTVPEPAVLGTFGLGILLIALFLVLRRRHAR